MSYFRSSRHANIENCIIVRIANIRACFLIHHACKQAPSYANVSAAVLQQKPWNFNFLQKHNVNNYNSHFNWLFEIIDISFQFKRRNKKFASFFRCCGKLTILIPAETEIDIATVYLYTIQIVWNARETKFIKIVSIILFCSSFEMFQHTIEFPQPNNCLVFVFFF